MSNTAKSGVTAFSTLAAIFATMFSRLSVFQVSFPSKVRSNAGSRVMLTRKDNATPRRSSHPISWLMVKVAKVRAKNPATVVRADKEIAFIVATNAISMLSLSGRVFLSSSYR